MGQKAIRGQKVPKKLASANKRINARAIGIWQRRMMGMQVQEIAKELGINDSTVWRNLHAVEQSGVIEDKIALELKKHEELWGLSLACVIANIKSGELKAAEDIFKYTGVWTDKLEVSAKVKPDEQQKKMIENIEALLKLSKGKVQEALPETTEAMKPEDTKQKFKSIYIKPEEAKPGAMFHVDKEGNRIKGTETKEIETQSQLECSCPKGIDGEPLGSFSIDSKCPVHGDKEKKHGGD